jgi:hypothetical protein
MLRFELQPLHQLKVQLILEFYYNKRILQRPFAFEEIVVHSLTFIQRLLYVPPYRGIPEIDGIKYEVPLSITFRLEEHFRPNYRTNIFGLVER